LCLLFGMAFSAMSRLTPVARVAAALVESLRANADVNKKREIAESKEGNVEGWPAVRRPMFRCSGRTACHVVLCHNTMTTWFYSKVQLRPRTLARTFLKERVPRAS